MLDIFTDSSKPFYRFGDLMFKKYLVMTWFTLSKKDLMKLTKHLINLFA